MYSPNVCLSTRLVCKRHQSGGAVNACYEAWMNFRGGIIDLRSATSDGASRTRGWPKRRVRSMSAWSASPVEANRWTMTSEIDVTPSRLGGTLPRQYLHVQNPFRWGEANGIWLMLLLSSCLRRRRFSGLSFPPSNRNWHSFLINVF